ncbi:unnamed protein product [Nezara viridula]|uniref:Uncharacterized protein n=1 Tax=Nezara viridula TaxID=85310 RepID=A0A9P0H5H0_NEZVI|nr:unnamed protein product [Nezara viridula]
MPVEKPADQINNIDGPSQQQQRRYPHWTHWRRGRKCPRRLSSDWYEIYNLSLQMNLSRGHSKKLQFIKYFQLTSTVCQ